MDIRRSGNQDAGYQEIRILGKKQSIFCITKKDEPDVLIT